MKNLIATLVLSTLAFSFAPSAAQADEYKIDSSRYGALVYSKSTGKYGYSWNQPSRASAERVALAECTEADAKVLTWVKFGWAVLIVAEDNAYGYEEVHGDGASSADAYNGALQSLRKNTKAKIKTVITICSGNVKPTIEEK